MKTPIRWSAAVFALALVAAPLSAQQATPVSPGEMEEALEARTNEVHDDRAAVDRVLSDERVEAVARDRGLDPDRIREGARGLEGEDLARVAEQARTVEGALAAQTMTFTVTTIIVALLVIILLILVLD